jgi:hypothetical protein
MAEPEPNRAEAIAQFDGFVAELRRLVEQQIQPSYGWYLTHTEAPRLAFRISGATVVIGSLLLPVITASKEFPDRSWVLTVVSLLVAVLSSLSTFFTWDSTWQSRRKAALDMQGFLAKWELALLSARRAEKPHEAAFRATQELFDKTFNLVGSETNHFFSNVKPPHASHSATG